MDGNTVVEPGIVGELLPWELSSEKIDSRRAANALDVALEFEGAGSSYIRHDPFRHQASGGTHSAGISPWCWRQFATLPTS